VAVYDQDGIRQGMYDGQSTSDISRTISNGYLATDNRDINNDVGLFDSGHIISQLLGESDLFCLTNFWEFF